MYIILDRKESDISTHLSLNDWYLVELYNIEGKSIGLKLEQVKSISDCWINNNSVETTRHQDNCKKIIASTNKYLYITHINMEYEHIYYPKPTDKWIKSFIKSLTEENIITDVKVNYIGIISHEPKGNKYDSMQFEPKLDSDGCIEIAII